MSLRKRFVAVVGIILACGMGAAAIGQEPQSQSPTAPVQDGTLRRERIERMQERRHERMERRGEGNEGRPGTGRHEGMGRLMSELNLSEQQRQQRRAIMERRLESTKVQREELFRLGDKRKAGTFTPEDEARAKALHQELRSSMETVRSEMAAVLTAEQRAKLEELNKERKQRREQRLKERQERLKNKPLSL
jgi:Spy/CpxP family protein refolding chaperone